MPDSLSLLNNVGVNTALYPPVFSAFQSVGQNIASGFGATAMTLGTPNIDTYSGWSSGSPTKYTPTTGGWYLILGTVGYSVNASGTRMVQIAKNGSGSFAANINTLSTASYFPVVQCTALYQMNGTTDFIELYAYQDSGSTLTSQTGFTSLTALRIHL